MDTRLIGKIHARAFGFLLFVKGSFLPLSLPEPFPLPLPFPDESAAAASTSSFFGLFLSGFGLSLLSGFLLGFSSLGGVVGLGGFSVSLDLLERLRSLRRHLMLRLCLLVLCWYPFE